MSINEIITRVENDELYMFLAVEIFVVAQSVNVYIYLCVCYRVFGLDVRECCMFIICACSSLELLFFFCLFDFFF